MSGIPPTILALLAIMLVREVESFRVSGNVHGGRLVLLFMLMTCRLVKPERKPGGIESNPLSSRLTSLRESSLDKTGNGPDRRFRCRLSSFRFESWFNSGGNMPERDFDERLMEETLLGVSQLTPGHLQKVGPVHPAGEGLRDLASLAMTAASSVETWWMRVEKMVVRRKRMLGERRLCLSFGIWWWFPVAGVLVVACIPTWHMRGEGESGGRNDRSGRSNRYVS